MLAGYFRTTKPTFSFAVRKPDDAGADSVANFDVEKTGHHGRGKNCGHWSYVIDEDSMNDNETTPVTRLPIDHGGVPVALTIFDLPIHEIAIALR